MINTQNFDYNESFIWCLVRYLHSTDHNPRKTTKVDKLFGDELHFKDINFLVKIQDSHNIEKLILSGLVFLVIRIKESIQSMCQKKL